MKQLYSITKGIFILFILISTTFELRAQMIVAPNIPVNQMVDRLVGPGVTYSNPTLTCPTNASGKFDNAILTTIAMDSGIVLTCGSALNTNQPASFFTSLSHNTTGGDANLQAAATGTIHDLCKLEFDFVPIGDTVKFYYRFGSEEYTNYTCSNFNDIFSFFISGPGYGAPTNVALIPGTNCPVSINTVNGSNANPCGGVFAPCAPPNNALYINNTFGTSIVYDGLTQKILARAAVTPCSTYHMKFAIADVYDNVLDSGVFLEAGSFVSEAATISSVVSTNNLPAANPFAIEGCNASTITVSRPNPKPYAQTVNFSYGGTATNGVDFPVLPAAVVIPAFGVSASFSVAPFQDFIPEGIENLKVYVYGTLCANYITDSVTIDILEYPNYTVSDNDTICQGQTAILTATPVPANPNLTFNWNPVGMVIPAVGNVVTTTPNVTTTYTVTATYPGCPLRDSTITIFVEPIPSISLTATPILCAGNTNASITATGVVLYGPASFLLQPGMITQLGSPTTFTNLGAGIYTVTVSSGAGCTNSASISIVAPPSMTWQSVTPTNIPCGAANIGQIQAIAQGGVPTISYQILPGGAVNNTGNFINLGVGVYTIMATDANGCSVSTVVSIQQPNGPTFTSITSTNPNCSNQNGAINVVGNGVGIITYVLNPGNITNNTGVFSPLAAGTYTIQIVDASLCTATTVVNLLQPPSLSVTAAVGNNIPCYGGNTSITVTVSGGTPAFQYSINGGPAQASNIFNSIIAGVYTISVTDANGCSGSSIITVSQPAILDWQSVTATNIPCGGGNVGVISAVAQGGVPTISYQIFPGLMVNNIGTFSNLAAGSYNIIATDANGCTAITSVTIAQPVGPTFTNITIVNPLCNNQNGSIVATATGINGPITYTLNPGNISNVTGTFSPLSAGVYTIQIVDASLCTTTTVVTLTLPPALTVNANYSPIPCNGGNSNITVSVTGGTPVFNYSLNGGPSQFSNIFNGVLAGVYTLSVTDANGCVGSTSITLTEPSSVQVQSVTLLNPSCVPGNDGSITIVATGGTPAYQYSIGGANQASNVFLNVAAGNYTITATDINGCSATSVVSIAAPNSPFITSLLATDVLCNGGTDGTITATASGGLGALNYNLQPGNQNNANGQFTNLGAGVYTITVGDANGCTVSNTIAIVEPSLLNWTVNIITNVNCNGGNDGDITIGAAGGTGIITYTLQPNNITNNTGLFPNLIAGVYTMTATDINGCTLVTTLQVTQGALLSWSTAVATNVTCNGGADGSITTSTTGGNAPINYNLQPGNQNNAIGTFTNLAAGVYTVLATDANGCSISTTLTITEPPILQITNVSTTAPSCVPGNDGSITIVATGGTPAYQYSIGGANQASNVFLNVAAGNYTITVTDINGCSVTSVVSIAAPNSPFITSLLATDVLCNGGTDGTITATASGGLGALNYNLQPGNQNNANGQFTNLGAGVYTITVGDANGCTVSSTIAIVEPSLLNWTVNIITNVNCNGGNDGDITIGAAGGTGIITYTLQPNNITNNTGLFPNLIAGVYTMTATDINGCTLVTTLQVTQGALLSWSTAVATNVTCNGGADGSIATNTTGGNAPINYNLQPGNQNNAIGTFTNLAAGVYTVLATDANGCSISTTLTITEPPILQITNVTTTAPSCVPGNDGSITIVASGGTPAYQYSIGGANQASNVFLNVAAGNYTITVTDINGCSATSVVSIAAPNSPFITSLLATDVLCNGGTDGTITATASGGLGALNYNLQPGNQNNANGQFTNLGAGVYTITVGDANGCTVSSTIAIVEPSLLNWTVNIITNVNCNGGNDGDITIGAAGGTGIISYTLQPNNITNNTGLFPNLIAGVYTMTATDINGCTLVTTLQVTQGALLSWSTAVATNVTCNGGADGSITTSTTGGNAPINYNLQPGNQNNAIGTFTNLAAGVYTVLATDANGCSISTTLTITEPPILQITNVTTTAPSCVPGNDGSITIVATGGTPAYQYSIGGANQASNVFLNVAAGNYTITVTDINGCSATSVVSIAAPNSPFITSLLATDVLCNGGTDGTITATASGGLGALNYNLQPGNQNNANGQFTNLGAGVYTITVGDANGCTVSSTIAIVEPSLLNWTVNIITNVNCNGGNDGDITIGAAGGTGIITYTLQPNNITNNTGLFPNLIAGVYTMTATDINGCTLVTTLQVTQGALLSWSTAVATNVTCNGGADGSITTSTTGGNAPINYNLQPGNQNNAIGTFTNLAAGVYTVLATDANGCSISTTLTITEPPILQITNVSTTAPSCVPGNDGSITIVATGGTPAYQYSIGGANQASNVFLNVAAGNYTITVTDINGCSVTSVVSIAAPNSPVITSLLATDVLCNGGTDGTITATASGGLGALNYNLQPGNQNNANGQFTNLGAGVYTITVGDANGCTVSSTIAIVEPSLLNWTVNIITNVNCNGGNDGDITIGAAGGTGIITYTLQPNNITNNTGLFPNLIAGVYTMTATDINGCTLVTTLQVTQGALLSWSTAVATNVTCNGGADGSITTSTTGGNAPINYNLQPGNQNNAIGTFTNLAAGVYTVLATDANGCSISTTLTITEPPILQITNVSTTAPSCVPGNDGSITIVATGGTPAYQYSIGGANQASNVFLNVAAGNYTITVTDINGCSATSMVSIAAPNAPTITSALTTDAACNPANTGTVTITAVGGTGIYNYSADGINFQLSNIITGLTAGTYTITVMDAIGCTATSAINIGNTPSPIITSILVTDATCVPGCDGTATIFAAGGNAIYTFSVDNINFQASNLFNSLCANIYTATVVDGNGCTNTSTFSISTANAPVLTINSTIDVLCNGGNNGALSVTAVGAGLITYLLQPIGLSNITGLFNNLTAFNYTIVATDANGCSSSTMVMISEPPVLQFTNLVNNAPLCSGGNNGTLDVSTTGGTGIVTYTINPFANFVPPATFNNLIGNTTYTVTATDANGCSITSSVFIGQPQAIVITNASSTDATCFGGTDGSISVQASGGTGILNYSILPNAQNNVTGIFNNVNANIYTVTVTDANNCTATTIVAVAEPSQIVLNTLTAANISCNNLNNGTIDINCSGGTGILSYNLLPVNITNLTGSFTNLLGGIYTIIVTDANGCTYNTTTSIINPTPLVIDSINSSNVLCSGGNTAAITLYASGGTGILNYNIMPQNINNATGVFNNLLANTYTITVTDANACSISTVVLITEPLPLTASVISLQNVLCSGGNSGQLEIGANGGTLPYTFTLLPVNVNNATGVFQNLFAGTYTVNVVDSNQCTTTIQPIEILEPEPIKYDVITKQDIKCFGDSTGTISVVTSGGTGNVVFDLLPNVGMQAPLGSFSLLTAGSYTIVATDANNCTLTTIVTLNQNAPILFTDITMVSPKCWGEANGIINVLAVGGVGTLTYWLNNQNPNNSGFFGALIGGNYLATVTDSLGCSVDTAILLQQPDRLQFGTLQIDPITCVGYSDGKIIAVATGGNGGYTYLLRPGLNMNQTGNFINLHEGIYTLSIRDSVGCEFDTIISVLPPANPLDIVISKKNLGCYGTGKEGWAQANIVGGEPPFTYLWTTTPPQTDAVASNLFYGYYTVYVVDGLGCKDKDSVYIEPGPCCDEVFIPNAFSPNGDGNNDLFRVTTSAGIELIQFDIYDRWGKRVWSTNDFRSGWNGMDGNLECDMNTYYYVFRYTCLTDGENYIKKGDINLIR